MANPPTQNERVLEFTAYGIPVPKGSVVPFQTPKGIVITPANPKLAQWTTAIRNAAGDVMGGPLWDGPIDLMAVFVFTRPKSVKRKRPSVKPDLDKLFRALGDALKGIVITEDARICHVDLSKIYGERPGCWARVKELES